MYLLAMIYRPDPLDPDLLSDDNPVPAGSQAPRYIRRLLGVLGLHTLRTQ